MPEADTTKPTKQKLYYEHIPQATPGFFLKGAGSLDWGMKNRLVAHLQSRHGPHGDAGD
jgi:putative autoinducer-2 (AI-2) aldolase